MLFRSNIKLWNLSKEIIFKDGISRFYSNTLQECAIGTNSLIEEQYNLSQRLLKVAVIGMPNAGKSTFINYLMDRKVCPASVKVHTTRKKAKAIFTEGDSQIIFVDTPGLVSEKIRKRLNLEASFIRDSKTSMYEADMIGIIHDVGATWNRERLDFTVMNLLEKYDRKPSFLVLNKIDMLKSKRKLLELTRLLTRNCLNGKPITKKEIPLDADSNNYGWPNFKDVFMVSSLTGSGLDAVKEYLIKSAKPGKWLFPADTWSDQTPEKIIVDTVKATLLDFLPQEIPYEMTPFMELYEINEQGVIHTAVTVTCSSERVATLVAGVSCGRLRQITEKTQKDLENIFQTFVNIKIVLQPPKESKK